MGDWNERKKLEEENRAQAARIAELEAAAAPQTDAPAADTTDDSVVTPENNPELYNEMVAHGKVPPPDEDE